MLSQIRLKHLFPEMSEEKYLLSDLDDTAVHHGVQPLNVCLDRRLLLQKTVKLLIHCNKREDVSILHHLKAKKTDKFGCKWRLYATTSTCICDL